MKRALIALAIAALAVTGTQATGETTEVELRASYNAESTSTQVTNESSIVNDVPERTYHHEEWEGCSVRWVRGEFCWDDLGCMSYITPRLVCDW